MFGFGNNDKLTSNIAQVKDILRKDGIISQTKADLSASTWVALGAAAAAIAAVALTVMENKKDEPEESVPETDSEGAGDTKPEETSSDDKSDSKPVAEFVSALRFTGRSFF